MRFRKRAKAYEAPSPEERRRLEAHRLDAVEQHRVRAHVERVWPTAEERLCPECDEFTSTKLCWKCGTDLSDSRPAGSSPLSPQAGTSPARVAGNARPGPDANVGGV